MTRSFVASVCLRILDSMSARLRILDRYRYSLALPVISDLRLDLIQEKFG